MPNVNVYLNPAEQDVLAPRMVGGEKRRGDRSATIQRIIRRYAELIRRSRPDLAPEEWKLVFDAIEGVTFDPPSMISALPQRVDDAIRSEGLAEKWKVPGQVVVNRLRRLSFGQLVAIVDEAERHFAAVQRGETPQLPGGEA